MAGEPTAGRPPAVTRRVLVTGATGFIGSPTVQRLLARGCEVHAVSRRPQSSGPPGLHWWQGDLSDAEQVGAVVARAAPEVIVHLAAEVSGERGVDRVLPMLRNNLLASVAILVAASQAGCRRVVLAGSLENSPGVDPDATPVSPYAAAKAGLEGYARMFRSLYGLDVITARIGMTYGPGQRDATKLVPYVIGRLLQGLPPEIGSGRRAVDWVYVDDVAAGLERACIADRVAEPWVDLGTGRAVAIREVVERLVARVDPSIVPAFGARPDRALDRDWRADAERTERLLGWRAETSLEEGLARTVDWFRAMPR